MTFLVWFVLVQKANASKLQKKQRSSAVICQQTAAVLEGERNVVNSLLAAAIDEIAKGQNALDFFCCCITR